MLCSRCHEDQDESEFGPSAAMWPQHRQCKRCSRRSSQLKRHGVTKEDRQQIADFQGGCAICGHHEPGTKGWVVDHDHRCCPGERSCQKCRRGVLCGYCNQMLGSAFDRIETLTAAIEYLKRHASSMTCTGWHAPIECSPRICDAHAIADANAMPT